MNEVHAIRVKGNPFSHGVERPIFGFLKGVDSKSDDNAKDPADPELRDASKVGHTVAGDQQQNKRRPKHGRYEWPDAIPKSIAKNSAEETWNIGGHIEVASELSGNQKA
jgi:hypothetical protein